MRYKKSQTKLLDLLPLEILERIAEIKFFRICEKFFKIQGDLTAIFNFIECISVLGTINIESLKLIALEGLSTNEIANVIRCSKRDISFVLNDAENTLKIKPKCEPSELKEILRFMGVFETLQNLKYK